MINPRLLNVFVPEKLKRYVHAVSDSRTTLDVLLDYLEKSPEFREFLWDRSRVRWRQASPDSALTWGKKPSGVPFLRKIQQNVSGGGSLRVLEIGPGYGRLLEAAAQIGFQYQSWTGVDISEKNIAYLREHHSEPRNNWIQGDIERVSLDQTFNLCLSSLTLKHMFPTLEAAVQNIGHHLDKDGYLIFDCIEGQRRYFEADGITWIRWYQREELSEVLQRTGFGNVRFDWVSHGRGYRRLLVFGLRL